MRGKSKNSRLSGPLEVNDTEQQRETFFLITESSVLLQGISVLDTGQHSIAKIENYRYTKYT